MTYTPVFTAFDEALQLKSTYSGSVMIQNIVNVARTRASVYLVTNPDAVIFDNDENVIDAIYDGFYADAVRDIHAVLGEWNRRKAVKATQPLRQQAQL